MMKAKCLKDRSYAMLCQSYHNTSKKWPTLDVRSDRRRRKRRKRRATAAATATATAALTTTAAAISCNKSHICRLCPFVGRICTFLLETDSLGELWEALAFFLGSFGPFYGEQIDCGRICPVLLETDSLRECGKLWPFLQGTD